MMLPFPITEVKMNMKRIIGDIIFIAVILLLISRFVTVLTGMAYPLSVVSSSSMEPSLSRGDIVPWIPCDVDDVKVGDVIVYRSVHGNLMIHRVVDVRNGKFITKGDANNFTDQEGPHVPEPMVGETNLCGRAIMVGSQPFRIPIAGYLWIFVREGVGRMSMPIKWREPQPARHYIIFTPFILSVALFLSLLSLWLPNGKGMKEKLHEMIFGAERISVRKTAAYLMTLFIPFLLLTSFFSYDHVSMEKNEEKFRDGIPVYNPSILPVRGVIFSDNDRINLSESIFYLHSGEGKTVEYYGEARGSVYLYSSPYWILMPLKIMHFFYDINPRICIFATSLLSAFFLSLITLFLLLLISLMVELAIMAGAYLSFVLIPLHTFLRPLYSLIHHLQNKINIMGIGIRNMAMWIEVANRKIFFASLATIPFIPLLFDGVGNLLLTAFIAAMAVASTAYFMGARFKNEIAIVSLLSSFIISSIFISRMISAAGMNVAILFEYVSLSFILAIFLFFIQFPVAIAISFLIHRIRESIDPVAMTEVCDI